MDAANLYRAQLDRFDRELHQALGNVLPLVAESAVGKVALARLLIDTAADLLEEDGGTDLTKALIEGMVRARFEQLP